MTIRNNKSNKRKKENEKEQKKEKGKRKKEKKFLPIFGVGIFPLKSDVNLRLSKQESSKPISVKIGKRKFEIGEFKQSIVKNISLSIRKFLIRFKLKVFFISFK